MPRRERKHLSSTIIHYVAHRKCFHISGRSLGAIICRPIQIRRDHSGRRDQPGGITFTMIGVSYLRREGPRDARLFTQSQRAAVSNRPAPDQLRAASREVACPVASVCNLACSPAAALHPAPEPSFFRVGRQGVASLNRAVVASKHSIPPVVARLCGGIRLPLDHLAQLDAPLNGSQGARRPRLRAQRPIPAGRICGVRRGWNPLRPTERGQLC